MNLNSCLSESIQGIVRTVLRASARNTRELIFVTKLAKAVGKAEKIRAKFENEGTHIPPFLIASIASQCNLHCTGCYARASGDCSDNAACDEMTEAQWGSIFSQADKLGISFILLAGGEPLMRKDVLTEAAKHPNIVYPVFTNGTMINSDYLDFFDVHRNLIPVISIEGDETQTDARRGRGMHNILDKAMHSMKSKGILYGSSITVTSENMLQVTSPEFISEIQSKGCGIIFYVEYVPAADGTESLIPGEQQRLEQEKRVNKLISQYNKIAIISFPGDEKHMGGCLAAGRGFFHINAAGGAEPCPFSPFSDTSLKDHTLLEALKSPLFAKLKERELLSLPHTGGCALFDKSDIISELIAN